MHVSDSGCWCSHIEKLIAPSGIGEVFRPITDPVKLRILFETAKSLGLCPQNPETFGVCVSYYKVVLQKSFKNSTFKIL